MKSIRSFVLLMFLTMITSCVEYQDAKITVRNNVSNVTLEDVYYGNYYVDYSLLPGQERELTITLEADEFPITESISFIMSANNSQVYLETEASYTLMGGDEMEVAITDTTAVANP